MTKKNEEAKQSDKKQSTESTSDKGRVQNAYNIMVTYDEPMGGVVTIVAESPDQAKERLLAMLTKHSNVKIHDVYNVADIPELQAAFELANERNNAKESEDETPPTVN